MSTGRVPATGSSPLTTKGDLYTYSTTQARLAVGSNGDTLVADSSASVGLSYRADWAAGKNKIINGDFRLNQRAFTSTTTTDSYGFDRWIMSSPDNKTTYSTQAFTAGTAPVAGYEGINFARLVSASQSAAGDYSILAQRIEDVRTCANSTVTVSFWAKAGTGTPAVAVELQQVFGSGGSSAVNTLVSKITISTTWTRYSASVAVPSISGKTIGTGSYLALNLWTSAGSTFNSRTNTLGIQSATIDFWGVQIEQGSVATAFQTATGTLAGELAACQRYYWRNTSGETLTAFTAAVGAGSTTEVDHLVHFPVPMRVRPTSMDQSFLSNYDGTTNYATGTFAQINSRSGTMTATVRYTHGSAALTQYRPYQIIAFSSATAYIGFSAEL